MTNYIWQLNLNSHNNYPLTNDLVGSSSDATAAVRKLHYPIGSQVGIGFMNEVKLMLLHPESPGNLISGNLIGYTSVSSQRFTLQVTRSHRIHV